MSILIPILVAVVIELVRRRLGTEKMKRLQEELTAKQGLALLAVRYVEQVYKDLHGEDKYNKAVEWLIARAADQGLTFTPDEIKGLVEAALRMMKDQFADQWEKNANQ